MKCWNAWTLSLDNPFVHFMNDLVAGDLDGQRFCDL